MVPTEDGCRRIAFRRDRDAPWQARLRFGAPSSQGVNDGASEEISIGPAGRVSIEYGYYVLGVWGGWSDLVFDGRNLKGRWGYTDQSGVETWERLSPVLHTLAPMRDGFPTGPAVAVGSPLALKTEYLGAVHSMRGNRKEQARSGDFWFYLDNQPLPFRLEIAGAPETPKTCALAGDFGRASNDSGG